jgi:bacterioferritin
MRGSIAMKGDPKVIEHLNKVLRNELTAINQYFLHARMLKNWGLKKLGEHEYHESIDEMKHAERVTDRIIYLDGFPNYQRYFPLHIGETVLEQFEADLALEVEAIARLNKGIELAVAKSDNGTRELLADILVEEEDHADWLETQLETIRQIGLENYLAQQLRSDDD